MRIPVTAKNQLVENRLAILDSASKVGKKELELLAKTMEGSTYGRDRIVYKVKSGDVLGSIAMRHKVRVADIKKWNNLRSDVIRSGQRLNIWLKGSPNNSVAASAKKSVTVTELQGTKTYIVQPGDTLWDISKKFSGLTIEKIKALNNLNNSKIQPGQKLIVGI
jgi:membrane-bound lytic murein transglycosylase D